MPVRPSYTKPEVAAVHRSPPRPRPRRSTRSTKRAAISVIEGDILVVAGMIVGGLADVREDTSAPRARLAGRS